MAMQLSNASAQQSTLNVDRIKQHPGPQTAARRVKVQVPGRFFAQLQPNEQKVEYEFLCPTDEEVVKRYNQKHHPELVAAEPGAASSSTSAIA